MKQIYYEIYRSLIKRNKKKSETYSIQKMLRFFINAKYIGDTALGDTALLAKILCFKVQSQTTRVEFLHTVFPIIYRQIF